LIEELDERQPRATLLLGAVAMKSLIGRTSITEMNGQVVEKDGRTYVCAFHPAYVLRDPSKEGALRMAISRYASVLREEFSSELPDYKPVTRDHFEEFLADWESAYWVAFDVETTSLEWWKDDFDINTIAFSMSDLRHTWEKNWALPLAKSPVLPEEARRTLLHTLAETPKKFAGHNAKFDNLCLMKRYGFRFPLYEDTMLKHHLVDENSAHGLKVLARQYCAAPDYDLTLKEKKGDAPIRKLLAYNAADAAYTRRLTTRLPSPDAMEVWLLRNVIMPAARIFEEIELNGLYVDLELMDKVRLEEERSRDQLEEKLNKIAGSTVNWNSPAQVAEVLYNRLKLVPTVFTEKNNPSTGEEALLDIKHPIGPLLVQYREKEKFLSTYIGNSDGTGGWLDYMVGPRLFLSTKLHGTVTGRYSSRLHQVPRDGTVRNLITAPDGWTFVQLDLSQAELRVVAIVSRDPELLRLFREGRDVHWRTLMGAIASGGGGSYYDQVLETARHVSKRKRLDFESAVELLSDLTPDEAIAIWSGWKEGRKKAKGINFGFVYGQSETGFIGYAKLKYGFEPTLEESTQFRNAYFSTYPGIAPWHERQKQLARLDGFVRSLSGRKRRLPGIYSKDRAIVAEAERQAINAPIQGFIGDYKAMILVELAESFPRRDLRIVGEVHDSILMWVNTERLKVILPEVKRLAEKPKLARDCGLDFPIPMEVDMEVGPWGAGKKWR
jgi:DNA polymerase-1